MKWGDKIIFESLNGGIAQKIINNNKEIFSPAGNAPKMSEQLLPHPQNASSVSSAALISPRAALMNDN